MSNLPNQVVNLTPDEVNVCDLPDLGIAMEAIEDKIIILIDPYKTGYECTVCKGSGKVESTVIKGVLRDCDNCKGKGEILVLPDTAKAVPSTGVIVSCGEHTTYAILKRDLRQARKIQAETENDPQNDNFYKIKIEDLEYDLSQCKIRPGARVLIGIHVGSAIPIRGGIKLKVLRQTEPLLVIYGTGNLSDSEILDPSKAEF